MYKPNLILLRTTCEILSHLLQKQSCKIYICTQYYLQINDKIKSII